MPKNLAKPQGRIEQLFINHKYAIFVVTAIAMAIRLAFFTHESTDYIYFLQPWFEEIANAGGFKAIGLPIGNYLVSYIYILAGLTYLPISSLYSIKLVSCIGDVILAYYCGKTAKEVTGRAGTFYTVYSVVIFLPTVILNSSAWAQCDSLYTAALVACVYYAVCEKPSKSLFAYGIAFVFKLQAVFLAPFILFLLLKKKVKIIHCFWVPLIYLVTILPAAIAGRSWVDLLTVYFRQSKTYSELSLYAPNPYAFVKTENTELFSVIGIAVFVVVTAVILFVLVRKPFTITGQYLVLLALLFALLTPYLLPHMHERYFYPADILAVVYAGVYLKRWYVPLIIVSCSFLVVCKFLFAWEFVSVAMLAIPLLCILLLLIKEAVTGRKNLKTCSAN